MTTSRARATVIPFPARRAAATKPDPQIVTRAKRQAWLAVCYQPLPTRIHAAAPWLGASPLTIAIWWRLRTRLWTSGPIADDPRQLAEAAHVPIKTWRSKAQEIGQFFHRTETGAWFDPDLEEARQRALAREEKRVMRRLRRKVEAKGERHVPSSSRKPRAAERIAAQGELAV